MVYPRIIGMRMRIPAVCLEIIVNSERKLGRGNPCLLQEGCGVASFPVGDLGIVSVRVYVDPYGDSKLQALIDIVQGLRVIAVIRTVVEPYYRPLNAFILKFGPIYVSIPCGNIYDPLRLLNEGLALGVVKYLSVGIGRPECAVVSVR